MKQNRSFLKNTKYLILLGVVSFVLAFTFGKMSFADEIYLFWQEGCSHCHRAIEFIDKKYPNLSVKKMDLADEKSRIKLIEIAKKYQLANQIGTPLFVIDDEVMMGWSKEVQEKFVQKAEKKLKK